MKRYTNKISESSWSDTEKKILQSSLTWIEIFDMLIMSGHNVHRMKGDRKLLANYLAGVLEGSIR